MPCEGTQHAWEYQPFVSTRFYQRYRCPCGAWGYRTRRTAPEIVVSPSDQWKNYNWQRAEMMGEALYVPEPQLPPRIPVEEWEEVWLLRQRDPSGWIGVWDA